MEVADYLRVVAVKKSRVKAAEFRLREGEKGLSVFAHLTPPGPQAILQAVRSMGKQGDLAIAVIPANAITSLGLEAVQTPGATGVPEVDAVHFELRWSGDGAKPFESESAFIVGFNDTMAPGLHKASRILESSQP